MATTEENLLNHVKSVMLAMTPALPAVDTPRVYVTPDEYGSVEPTVPFIIINQQQDAVEYQGVRSALWNAEIFIFLHKGVLKYPSADYAAAELAARSWKSDILDWLKGKKPFALTGNRNGTPTADFTAMQFDQRPYNGLYFVVPVKHDI